MNTPQREHGFSLMEVLVGIFLVGVAVIGLAQVFLVAVTNNLRADRIANATFLAQQQIDWLRGFTLDELMAYAGTTLESRDEIMDLNADGQNDYRRVTVFSEDQDTFRVQILVYSAENVNVIGTAALIGDMERYRPRAMISTLITR
jgi:prepilin-type N-terminal cleavage/methylation domain-containing protein